MSARQVQQGFDESFMSNKLEAKKDELLTGTRVIVGTCFGPGRSEKGWEFHSSKLNLQIRCLCQCCMYIAIGRSNRIKVMCSPEGVSVGLGLELGR